MFSQAFFICGSLLWPVSHFGSPASPTSIKLLNTKLNKKTVHKVQTFTILCLLSEKVQETLYDQWQLRDQQKNTISVKIKQFVSFLEYTFVTAESLICFQLSSCLHLLFSGATIKHSEAKQPVEERVHFPTSH